MSIESAIRAVIAADTAVTAIIKDRLYPLRVPQGVSLPAVTYQEISGDDGMTTDGALGLVDGRFQFTCWSTTHAGAAALRDALIACFKAGVSGVYSGVTIQASEVVGRGDVANLDSVWDQAEGLARFGKYVDCIISFEE